MPWYNVIFSKLVVWLLPVGMRKAIHVAFLRSLVEPMQQIHGYFLLFREEQLYELAINGQVINLERVLNDTFDPMDRRIYITDGEYFEPPIFYEEYKDLPVVFNAEANSVNPIFWNETNIENRVSVNFYVWIPSDILFDINRLKASVTKYKIFGRTFEIKTII